MHMLGATARGGGEESGHNQPSDLETFKHDIQNPQTACLKGSFSLETSTPTES